MSAAKLAAPCVSIGLGLVRTMSVMWWSGAEGMSVPPKLCPGVSLPVAPLGQLFGQVNRGVLYSLSLPAGLSVHIRNPSN